MNIKTIDYETMLKTNTIITLDINVSLKRAFNESL